jgi:hypothetical protein
MVCKLLMDGIPHECRLGKNPLSQEQREGTESACGQITHKLTMNRNNFVFWHTRRIMLELHQHCVNLMNSVEKCAALGSGVRYVVLANSDMVRYVAAFL